MVIEEAEVFVTKNVRPVAVASVTMHVYVPELVKLWVNVTDAVVLAAKVLLPITIDGLVSWALVRVS